MSKRHVHIPWVDPNKPLPLWLQRYVNARLVGMADEYAAEFGKTYQRSCEYYLHLRAMTPLWQSFEGIAGVYRAAYRMRKRGSDVVVDHIVPLHHPHVCGLHCEANLRIIDRLENERKSNSWWPGMANEQLELFDRNNQFELNL